MSQGKWTYTALSCSPHTLFIPLELDPTRVYGDLAFNLQGWWMTSGCRVLTNSVFDQIFQPWFSLLRTYKQQLRTKFYSSSLWHTREIRGADFLVVPWLLDPGNCTQSCILQEDCQKGFQCSSAFCGGSLCIKQENPEEVKGLLMPSPYLWATGWSSTEESSPATTMDLLSL